jgi:hypothetical protein
LVCLGSAQAQTSAVDQKVEAKVVTDLRQNARTIGQPSRRR